VRVGDVPQGYAVDPSRGGARLAKKAKYAGSRQTGTVTGRAARRCAKSIYVGGPQGLEEVQRPSGEGGAGGLGGGRRPQGPAATQLGPDCPIVRGPSKKLVDLNPPGLESDEKGQRRPTSRSTSSAARSAPPARDRREACWATNPSCCNRPCERTGFTAAPWRLNSQRDCFAEGRDGNPLSGLWRSNPTPREQVFLRRGKEASTTHSRAETIWSRMQGRSGGDRKLAARHPQQAQRLELGAPQDRLQKAFHKIRRDCGPHDAEAHPQQVQGGLGECLGAPHQHPHTVENMLAVKDERARAQASEP